MGDQIRALEDRTRSLDKDLDDLLLTIPNIPREDVPIGEDETGNVVVRTAAELPSFDFDPIPHWELGERLGIIDLQRGAKVSGSRFCHPEGEGGPATAVSDLLDAGPSYPRARLRGGLPAQHGEQGYGHGQRPPSQVRRHDVPRRRGRPVDDPHRPRCRSRTCTGTRSCRWARCLPGSWPTHPAFAGRRRPPAGTPEG